jgi:hypothetical protein
MRCDVESERDATLGPPLQDGAQRRLRHGRHRVVPRRRPQRRVQLRRPVGIYRP